MNINTKQNLSISHKNLGDKYRLSEQFDQSIREYNLALDINPLYWQAHANLSIVFEKTNQLSNAIYHAEKALYINPTSKLHDNLGRILYKSNNFSLATTHHKEAIKLDPTLISAYMNLGNSLREEKKPKQAIDYYKKTIDLAPTLTEAYINLGNLLKQQKLTIKAINIYQQAKYLDPKNIEIISNLFICYRTICDWNKANLISKELDILHNSYHTLPTTAKPSINPFINLYRQHSAKLLLDDTIAWSNNTFSNYYKQSLLNFSQQQTSRKSRIRVGYISGDFGNHPVGILTHHLFEHHDKSSFEIYTYSYKSEENNSYVTSVKKGSEHFRDITYYDDLSASKLIFDDDIDILVDLTGLTSAGRYKICAYKPAPIQINYLGFPGSSGAKHFDYIITDHILTPLGYEEFYSEKLIRLPNCYQVNSQKIPPSINNYTRDDFNLPRHSIVFCSFNNPRKIDDITFDIWMKILLKVKNSVIWLLKTESAQERQLIKEAESRGISSERIIFTNSIPLSNHVARHKLADIALDTIGYNGGMTTSLALYSNIPVVTFAGDKYISRMSASLLSSVSLDDIITYSLNEYIEQAIKLATDHALIIQTKKILAANIHNLYNTDHFALNLENAYNKIWTNYINNHQPSHFDI